jgi:hypothetical protein
VYIDKTGDDDIDHDVEVVGWGETEDGLKYWEVSSGQQPPTANLTPTLGLVSKVVTGVDRYALQGWCGSSRSTPLTLLCIVL